jgi:hypothetical protein
MTSYPTDEKMLTVAKNNARKIMQCAQRQCIEAVFKNF